MEAREGRRARPPAAIVLRTLAEGLRTVTVLLHPYMPETHRALLDALGETGADRAAGRRGVRRRARRGGRRRARAAVPEAEIAAA